MKPKEAIVPYQPKVSVSERALANTAQTTKLITAPSVSATYGVLWSGWTMPIELCTNW